MLIHNAPHLCLINAKMKVVRQIEWTLGSIYDLCWNTKLNQIFLVGDPGVFTIDPQTLTYKQILGEKYYMKCTCSSKILYLTIYPAREVLAHCFNNLHSPKSVYTCPQTESVQGMCYNADKLALVINTRNGTEPYVEILSTITYTCLFSLILTGAFGSQTCGISSLDCSGWLMKDPSMYNLFHITEKNTLRMTPTYKYDHPCNAIRLRASYLAILTKTSVKIHKLKFVASEDLTA
jgi:hypothetical protein